MLDSAIIDLNNKTTNLFSESLFSESITLSRLFKLYCICIIILNDFALHGEKLFEDYEKYRTERTML